MKTRCMQIRFALAFLPLLTCLPPALADGVQNASKASGTPASRKADASVASSGEILPDDSLEVVRRKVADKKAALLNEFHRQEKAIRDQAEALVQAEKPVEWTDSDTEWFWSRIVDSSTATSTGPRFAQADEEGGEGVLEAFGTQYLPNAYAYYQEVRAIAQEREQVLKENFPEGRSSDATGGSLYDKVQKATSKAVAEMFRRHDELCHFLLMHRMGAIADRELAEADAVRIAIVLPEEADAPGPYDRTAPEASVAERDFATKYMPETWAGFQRLENLFSEGRKSYANWRETAVLVDATRCGPFFGTLRSRLDGIHEKMDGIVKLWKEKKLLHAVGEATASDLADSDQKAGLALQQFEKGLPIGQLVRTSEKAVSDGLRAPRLQELENRRANRIAAIRGRASRQIASARAKMDQEKTALDRRVLKVQYSPVISEIIASMVQIRRLDLLGDNYYKVCKYEVTQSQWEAIMGKNPSFFKGANNPVEQVSWDDCQEFLTKLNALLPLVDRYDLRFRFPTLDEWQNACHAGEKPDWSDWCYCHLADGTQITRVEKLGRVAWLEDNSDGKTHPVGEKEPHAFGLYDMFGNVNEWFDGGDQGGGGWKGWDGGPREKSCKSSSIGFRLYAD